MLVDVHVNHRVNLQKLFQHQSGAVVEYPETSADGYVGHMDPKEWSKPWLNFAYSQGPPKGCSRKDKPITYVLLVDPLGNMVPCQEYYSTCA